MKANEFIKKYTIDPVEDIQPCLSRILTKEIDTSSDFHCINCDDKNNLSSYPSAPWTSVLYCRRCNCINVIYYADRMGGIYKDTVECYQ